MLWRRGKNSRWERVVVARVTQGSAEASCRLEGVFHVSLRGCAVGVRRSAKLRRVQGSLVVQTFAMTRFGGQVGKWASGQVQVDVGVV